MAKQRNCSYCDRTGHNRRTCLELKNDQGTIQWSTNKYREAFVKRFEEVGFGPGALVSTYDSYREKETHFIVRSLSFEDVGPLATGTMGKIVVSQVGKMHHDSWQSFGDLPPEFNDLLRRNTDNYESARKAGKNFKDKTRLIKFISPVNKVVLKDYRLRSDSKNYSHRRTFERYNITPSSYRQDDKWKNHLAIKRFEEYLEQNTALPAYIHIW